MSTHKVQILWSYIQQVSWEPPLNGEKSQSNIARLQCLVKLPLAAIKGGFVHVLHVLNLHKFIKCDLLSGCLNCNVGLNLLKVLSCPIYTPSRICSKKIFLHLYYIKFHSAATNRTPYNKIYTKIVEVQIIKRTCCISSCSEANGDHSRMIPKLLDQSSKEVKGIGCLRSPMSS